MAKIPNNLVPVGLAAGALLLTSSIAEAAVGQQILVAKNTDSDAIAVYRKSASGTCSKEVLAAASSYDIRGTNNDDKIVVLAESDPVNFCGYTSIQPFYLLDGGYISVTGEYGSDQIWAGSAPSQTSIDVYGGQRFGDDNAQNFIYIAGSRGTASAGSRGDYIIALNGADGDGAAGNDVFCTKVSTLLMGPASWLDGHSGYPLGPNEQNSRYGEPAISESKIQSLSSEDIYLCDYVYAALSSNKQMMLQ